MSHDVLKMAKVPSRTEELGVVDTRNRSESTERITLDARMRVVTDVRRAEEWTDGNIATLLLNQNPLCEAQEQADTLEGPGYI